MRAIATVLVSAATVALLATAGQAKTTRAERSEARLSRMIEGRTAGEPLRCIAAIRSRDLEVLEYVGVVYDAGDTIYVARARDPKMLAADETPIFDRNTSQLCTSDISRTVDLHSGMTGVVFLEDFVPYTKQG